MPVEDINEIKSDANSLFRDGDYLGAATTFQQALDAIEQVSRSNAVEAVTYADLELACLCNLSLAWIKLGSMVKAEEACCRALLRWPSSAKALFRRGQARLALGRPTEAAADFREVAVQEPTNTEATKMLRRALEEADRPMSPRVNLETQQERRGVHDGGGLTSSPFRAGTTSEGGTTSTKNDGDLVVSFTTTVHEDTTAFSCAQLLANSGREENETSKTAMLPHHDDCSPPETGRMLNASEEAENHKRPEDGISTESSPVSSFMVSDWLNSAARKQAEQKVLDKRKPVFTDEPQDVPSSTMRCDNRSGSAVVDERNGGDASVSRLVSQLKARKSSKQRRPPRDTRTPEAESEWSRLQAEEMGNVQVYRRRYEGVQAEMLAKKAASRQVIHPREDTCAKKGGKASSGDAARGNDMAMQTSQWASLEEEEKQVRDAFRAKLCMGNKKKIKKKKKNAVLRMSAGVPP